MAEKKSKIEEHQVVAPAAVTSTTETAPTRADESSEPGPYGKEGAGLNDPPVRTNRPDVPIAQSLAAGAGAHTPPPEEDVDASGRAVYDEQAASEKGEPERVPAGS